MTLNPILHRLMCVAHMAYSDSGGTNPLTSSALVTALLAVSNDMEALQVTPSDIRAAADKFIETYGDNSDPELDRAFRDIMRGMDLG